MGRRHRRNNLPRHSPRRARPAAAEDAAVRAEQDSMNKLLQKLYGPNARLLNVDGKAGPATNGVRALLDKAFPEVPGESRQQRMQRLTRDLDTPEGQTFRANPANAQAFNELQAGVDGLPETPNGFQPRTGPAPDLAAPVAAAPPAAPAVPPVPFNPQEVDPEAALRGPPRTGPAVAPNAGAADVDPEAALRERRTGAPVTVGAAEVDPEAATRRPVAGPVPAAPVVAPVAVDPEAAMRRPAAPPRAGR